MADSRSSPQKNRRAVRPLVRLQESRLLFQRAPKFWKGKKSGQMGVAFINGVCKGERRAPLPFPVGVRGLPKKRTSPRSGPGPFSRLDERSLRYLRFDDLFLRIGRGHQQEGDKGNGG